MFLHVFALKHNQQHEILPMFSGVNGRRLLFHFWGKSFKILIKINAEKLEMRCMLSRNKLKNVEKEEEGGGLSIKQQKKLVTIHFLAHCCG